MGSEPLLGAKSNESLEWRDEGDEEGGESKPERMKDGYADR